MKGSPEVIAELHLALKGELIATSQYFLHASLFRKWGYLRLYKKMYDESIEEMKHAEQLIDRILFLEGIPTWKHTPRNGQRDRRGPAAFTLAFR